MGRNENKNLTEVARVMQHIAVKSLKVKAEEPRLVNVVSDIDDTLFPGWLDRRHPLHIPYLGVSDLFVRISRGLIHQEVKADKIPPSIAFLTARPRGWLSVGRYMTVQHLNRPFRCHMIFRSSPRPKMTQIVGGLGAIADKYDVFLVDQYGVLHNGSEAYAGAVTCFNRLVQSGKRVVLLSNTSKRASSLRGKLAAFGFVPNFLGAVTGGEVAWTYLNERKEELLRCALMTADVNESVTQRRTNTQSLFHGLDHLQVVDMDAAQFLLVEGSRQVCYSDDLSKVLHTEFHTTGQVNDHITSFLKRGRERNLPMLCTNPDLVAMLKDNQMVHMGGKLAKMYEEMGGEVVYFGKPRKEHFEVCLDMAQVTDRTRVVHIGDSLHHDIQGAVNTSIDSIFIAGGVHAAELGMNGDSGDMEPELLQQLCAKSQLDPTYTLASFVW